MNTQNITCPFCHKEMIPRIRKVYPPVVIVLVVILCLTCVGIPFAWMLLLAKKDEQKFCSFCGMKLQ